MRLTLALIVSLISIGCGSIDSSLPIDRYEHKMSESGFIDRTIENQDEWFSLLSDLGAGFIEGDQRWLPIASEFRKSTDAGASESLNISISKALPYQPEMVLQAVDYGFDIHRLCIVPFIEPDEKMVEEFVISATAKLQKLVDSGNLRAKTCMNILSPNA